MHFPKTLDHRRVSIIFCIHSLLYAFVHLLCINIEHWSSHYKMLTKNIKNYPRKPKALLNVTVSNFILDYYTNTSTFWKVQLIYRIHFMSLWNKAVQMYMQMNPLNSASGKKDTFYLKKKKTLRLLPQFIFIVLWYKVPDTTLASGSRSVPCPHPSFLKQTNAFLLSNLLH